MPDYRETPSTDAWIARVTELIGVAWIEQGWRFPAVPARMRLLAGLIARVTPRLATPSHLSKVEYQQHLRAEMGRLLPLLGEPGCEALARRLTAAHAIQYGTEVEVSGLDGDAWISRIAELTGAAWMQRGWRYPDQADRTRRLAGLIALVQPRLATPGHLSTVEYREHLRVEMHQLLSFLDEPVREALAGRLIAEHARQCSTEILAAVATARRYATPI